MTSPLVPLPTDLAAAHAMIIAERTVASASTSTEVMIAHLKLEIEKLRRLVFGSERKARLLEQMELQLEELEAAATEDVLAAEKAASRTGSANSFQRKRPSRKPFPEHLPRERVVIPAPACCPSCGSAKLSKLGEDVTERRLLADQTSIAALEVIPRRWKVIQTVREKFSCGHCETITFANVYRERQALTGCQRHSTPLRAALPFRTSWR